ncbi:hypothetical protein LPJ66_005292, partial [Kickxella alabastrina]
MAGIAAPNKPQTLESVPSSILTTNEHLDDIDELADKPEHIIVAEETNPHEVEPAKDEAVGLLRLFRFADKTDRLLTFAGICFSCAAGVVTPIMIIIFSSLMG